MLSDDRGSVTIEAALALSSLVIVTAAIIGGLATMAASIAAVDAAGAAARSHAIGVDYQPPRGSVTVSESSGLVTAHASVPAPFGDMRAEAVFPTESTQ